MGSSKIESLNGYWWLAVSFELS